MLYKTCNQIIKASPLTQKQSSKYERRILPLDSSSFRYLRFRAIGNFEKSGANGNCDAFPYNFLEDERPGYGYKSFINKRAHVEHDSKLGFMGSIGDLPDAFLNRFNYPDEVKEKKWASLLSKNKDALRKSILEAKDQTLGDIEVLMRIDTQLVKSATHDKKTKELLERIVRMIDTGQNISCSMGCFAAGAPITMADKSTKPIDSIKFGDSVISHTGSIQKVIETMVRKYKGEALKIITPSCPTPLIITFEHPIGTNFDDKTNEVYWVDAGDLTIDNKVLGFNKDMDLIRFYMDNIEVINYEGDVYNFEVEHDHSYVAGGIIVHNCNVNYSTCSVCPTKARYSSEYCTHLRPGNKGRLTSVSANQMRDLLDSEHLRPEWLPHILSSQRDVQEVLQGQSSRHVIARNLEINHELSFFELSVVASPAYKDAIVLEKYARQQDEDRDEYLHRLAKDLGRDNVLDLYDFLIREGDISSACSLQ
ncbi:MAG: Hint domain-containing protein [Candidatus Omnitrophica bacterium]|jgi:hypothetical protein|nr:Hint domain-containing protein [Candidatus Omnitrophota bacterium]